MKPNEELKQLKSKIKLTESEAIKRDLLETFLSDRNKLLLLDADSLVYKALYKVVTITQIKELMIEHFFIREDVERSILELALDRYDKMYMDIVNSIEEEGFIVSDVCHFLTMCKRNFRKTICQTYKANRKRNKWVYKLQELLIDELYCVYDSNEFEADDLISGYVQECGSENSIICSIDKDLKQIPGCHFDYYQLKVKDGQGNLIMDGDQPMKEYRGFSYTTPEEGSTYIAKQMLIGDTSDNIKGVYGIGEKKSTKLLANKTEFGKFRAVVTEYIKEGGNWKDKLIMNYKLMKL